MKSPGNLDPDQNDRAAQGKTAPGTRARFNMVIRDDLKIASLAYVRELGYSLAEYVERMLEWRLIRAGRYKPAWMEGTPPDATPPRRNLRREKPSR